VSLADSIDEAYESLQNNEEFDFTSIDEGKAFIGKLIFDFSNQNRLLMKHSLEQDRRGWLKNTPFPITVEILNRHETPGEEVHIRKGHMGFIVVYYGLCPELENFVSITLWPQSNTSKIAYKKIYTMVKNDTENKDVLKFNQNYGLQLPNSVRPYNDLELDTIPKPSHAYDWKLVPYIKDGGDSIKAHVSPLNFKKVYLDQIRHITSYVDVKTIIGRVVSINEKFVEILIPTLFGEWLSYRAKVSTEISELIKNFEVGSLNHFLIMRQSSDNVDTVIKDIYPADPVDLTAHLLSYILYSFRINFNSLRLTSLEEYERLYQRCLSLTMKFCRREQTHNLPMINSKTIFEGYLSPFFRIIDGQIYAIPCNQYHLSNKILKMYDEHLNTNTEFLGSGQRLVFDEDGMMVKPQIHRKIFKFIRFFNEYNKLLKNNISKQYITAKLASHVNESVLNKFG
jgi:hypothetical protein